MATFFVSDRVRLSTGVEAVVVLSTSGLVAMDKQGAIYPESDLLDAQLAPAPRCVTNPFGPPRGLSKVTGFSDFDIADDVDALSGPLP